MIINFHLPGSWSRDIARTTLYSRNCCRHCQRNWYARRSTSLEPRLSIPNFVSQLWRKIGGKAYKDFSCDVVAPWRHLPSTKATRHTECYSCCVLPRAWGKDARVKTKSKAIRVIGRVGSLFTKRSYRGWLDILVVKSFAKILKLLHGCHEKGLYS